jgi:hypothetical protein
MTALLTGTRNKNVAGASVSIGRAYIETSRLGLEGVRPMTDTSPYYINERQSDLRRVKEGWYAMDDLGHLLSGPFSNRETCLTRISRSADWSASFAERRPG